LGVDAPELGQTGWQRDYSTVDIGEASTQKLKDYLAGLRSSVGPIAHRSFGRPVAPVDAGGSDLGQSFIRSGGAFAAPDYLADDPDRRFDYMQAERLARLNQLGVHDTFQQMPDKHRDNPQYVAPRET